MIYARQIAPEYQDAGCFMEAYTEGEQRINVCGNERFADYTSEDFDRLKEIVNSWELAYVLENLSSYGYANAADAIMYYLPPMKERYTDRDIYDLNLLFTDSHGWEFEHHDNNIPYGYLNTKENFLCEVLSIVYGEKWTWNVIRGSAQVDWNNVFYPVAAFTDKNIERFETLYFNEGTEWMVSDDLDEEPNSAEEIDGMSVYCCAWNLDGIKEEIADECGVSADKVKLYVFSRWTQMPVYEVV